MADRILRGLSYDKKYHVEPNLSLGSYLLECLRLKAGHIAQIDGLTGRTYSFEYVEKLSIQLASSLQKEGVKFNDVVGICCENRLEYLIVILATLYLGTILVPINPLYTKDEIIWCMNISFPKIIFSSKMCLQKVCDAASDTPCVNKIISFDGLITTKNIPVLNYNDLIERVCPLFTTPSFDPTKQTAVILSSSGTTGMPKGVKLSHSNLKSFLSVMRDEKYFVLKEFQKILFLIPFFHGYGYGMLLTLISNGGQAIILPKFDETLFLSCIEKYKIQVLPVVPSLLTFIAKHPIVDKYDLSSVTDVISGGAPCGEAVMKEAAARLKIPGIHQGYGMTESTIITTFCHASYKTFLSVGKLIAGISLKVVDIKTGRNLGPNEVGELCFTGPCVMQGYCNNDEATKETIDSQNWLHTGDIGYYDTDQFIYVVGRIKELIKYKAFQVAPAELEALIMSYRGVQDVAVIGLPHPLNGEHPAAFVVKQPNVNITADEIQSFVKGKVSTHKWLRGGVYFVQAIPKNPGGKILRRILKDEFLKKAKL